MEEVKFILGIDWGKSKIGLSVADSLNRLATPYSVVKKLDDVLQVINREDITTLVIGKPVHMSGTADKLTAGFGTFVSALAKQSHLDVHLVDERLTSKAAQSLPGGKKTKAKEDAIAAMLILQTWLDTYGRK